MKDKPNKVKELEKIRAEINKLRGKAEILLNSKEVKDYNHKLNSDRALKFVKKELKQGNMVWCRNANVRFDATPCMDVECDYKNGNDDISDGCSKCHRFQVTTFANNWDEARHINAKWMDSLGCGW